MCPPLRPSSPTPLRSSSQKKLSTSARRRKSWPARTRTPASPPCCTVGRPEKTRRPFWQAWTQQTQTMPLFFKVQKENRPHSPQTLSSFHLCSVQPTRPHLTLMVYSSSVTLYTYRVTTSCWSQASRGFASVHLPVFILSSFSFGI